MYRADSQLGGVAEAGADTRPARPAAMELAHARIAAIGLGYVGLPLAVEFGKQRPVLGFDINPERTRELRQRRDGTLEVTPKELHAASKLTFSSDPDHLQSCQIFIVTVPTPVDRANRPDMGPLIKASKAVGRERRHGAMNSKAAAILARRH